MEHPFLVLTDEFAEAREGLGFLEKDYLDVLSEQATDEAADEDDD
eukprot:CAMPEP_0197073350 /NCGR_PEP_ID=MMETSP1384-20130603/210562_1 /TAXON_ID=29189 /ORGANISM="Ammonia sp." /LENGTH=44 /DNA_ID= /DNA_START= /DNA_END= /DNA_ORIENTATION=